MRDKAVHIWYALSIGLLCIVSILWKQSLVKDPETTLGTLGTFATIYGVIFAIIEVMRVKAAAILVKEESERVLSTVTSLVKAREIIECQALVTAALSSVDDGRAIPNELLSRILKLYSQVFHSEVAIDTSPHRKNRSVIESYVHSASASTGRSAASKTQIALRSVSSQLGEVQGATKNLTEYGQ
jgi:hypothetical protein